MIIFLSITTFLILCCYNVLAAFLFFLYSFFIIRLITQETILLYSSIIFSFIVLMCLPFLNLYAIFILPGEYFSIINEFGLWGGLRKIFYISFSQWRVLFIDNGVFSLLGLCMLLLLWSKYFLIRNDGLMEEEKNKKLMNEGIYIGVDNNNKKIIISDLEFNQHSLVLGTTGSGKTTTLMNIIDSCCRRELPLIYLDGKGSIGLIDRIKQICDKYNRTLKVFTVNPHANVPNLSCYNPLAFGNFSEWKNKIVTLMGEAENKGQEHFLIEEQNYINLVCEIINKSGKTIDLEGLLAYLHNPDELQKIANKISPEIGLRLLRCNQNDEKTIDIIKVLDMFYYSQYGQLFSTSGKAKDKVINIKESLEKKEIVLFLFDAASYKTDTSLLGKLVINDINNAWASFGSYGRSVKGYCIFDEFAAYASSNLSNVLALQRDNGLHAVVGTQSINAIKTDNKSLKRVAVELIANCNTYIVHKLNDPEDILLLQNAIGKYKTYEANIHVNSSNNSKYKVNEQTGISYRLSEEFYLDGHEIRKLTPGNGFIYCGVINDIPRKIKFNYIC